MKQITKNILVFGAVLLGSSAVLADDSSILTDANGMTLYTFDKDSAGESNCYGPCAAKWPPFLAGDYAQPKAGWGFATRQDGSRQWTYNGQPLYTWIGDTKAGDTTGDGVGGVWHTAKKIVKSARNTSAYGYSASDYSYGSNDYSYRSNDYTQRSDNDYNYHSSDYGDSDCDK